MRAQKILRGLAITCLIVCIIFIAIDLFKMLKINFDFLGMQSSERISLSSNVDEIRYEPTEYTITNKEDALTEIKKIAVELKEEHVNSNKKVDAFEIANIHKIEGLFYEYEKYVVVKYKLLNIIEDLPKLKKSTNGYSNTQLVSYFKENSEQIEGVYGISNSDEFVKLAKSLSFLGNGNIKIAVIVNSTVYLDTSSDTLTFCMRLIADNGEQQLYDVKSEYYDYSDNQVKPYVTFTVND